MDVLAETSAFNGDDYDTPGDEGSGHVPPAKTEKQQEEENKFQKAIASWRSEDPPLSTEATWNISLRLSS